MKKEYLTNKSYLLFLLTMLFLGSILFLGLKKSNDAKQNTTKTTSTYNPIGYKKKPCIIKLNKTRDGVSQVNAKLPHNFGEVIKVSGIISVVNTNCKGRSKVIYINIEEIDDTKLKKIIKLPMRYYYKFLDEDGKKVTLIGYETIEVGGYPWNVVEENVESLSMRGYYIFNAFVWMEPHTKFKDKN
ncbi:hypothetical protein AAEX28_12190 [Lentisphaerota bacterium WC36G]|nr:hypothetical protein LJT99_15020 [Lentisphaerae bacterium WC36]